MSAQDASAQDKGFAAKVRTAIFWRSGGQIIAQMVSWTSTLLVMRLLTPGDYGLFAMTQVLLNFMQFLNGYGLVSALVQTKSLTSHQVRQAFGIMLLLNGTLAALQLIIAPFAADYYDQPLIADLLRVQALIYLSTPFIAIPEVLMARKLDFRRPAIVGLISSMVAALVALTGAFLGWGVWTLVFAPIAGFYVRGIGYLIISGFVPIPSFNFRGTGWMIAFGAPLLGSQFLIMVQTQTDIIIGGRMLPAHELGLYAEALFLTQIFVARVLPPLNDVAFPAYARMQEDRAALNHAFCRATRLIMMLACPVYLGMAVTAQPLVLTLFGPKWAAMVPFVAIIAASMPFYTLQQLLNPAMNAIGRPGLLMRIAAIGAVVMPLAYFVGIQIGAIGLAWAWAVGIPILALVATRIATSAMDMDMADLLKAMIPGFSAAAIMALCVWAVDQLLPRTWATPLHLGALVATGAAVYTGVVLLAFPAVIRDFRDMLRK
ncbi:MAG: lipopolysaccharide biosynthesis protein [Sphingobium sp.]|nr:lipopolysaccharide biosynthesis protein [Sphingobium sp.]